jgi:membrane-associated protein
MSITLDKRPFLAFIISDMDIKSTILQLSSFGSIFVYLALFLIVFAESGLFVGFFLPGDTLLFAAGFLASENILNLPLLLVLFFIAAVTGDTLGYKFGRKYGRNLFNKPDSRLFHQDNLQKAEEFYEKHGKSTIILARFIPVIRTFAPIVAGIGNMDYKTFLSYNIVGGFVWTVGVTLAGYFLGQIIPDIDKILLPVILGVVVISVLSSLVHLRKK